MNPLLQQLIDFLKSASPIVWSTFVRQVYTYAGADFIWVIGLSIASIFLVKLGKYGKKISDDESYSGWEIGYIFSFIGSAIAGGVAFGLLISGIMGLINPQYYAIQLILSNLH